MILFFCELTFRHLDDVACLFGGLALKSFHMPVDLHHIDPVAMFVTVGDRRLRRGFISIL